ncbi:uncharacterized protein LOC127861192 isoform X6 [Dreissena polymorpha]|uniref:uncharacterized protein LOC127861192 isoform X6 n=1 Tax=Dreissena polymorpha TaxID=45954 RepID=UPI00226497D6|nr:uncharacterized protein LOC127861192 isoform X6 [Dreissena polymorpha]
MMLRITCNMTTFRNSSKMLVFLSLLVGQAAPDADVLRDWYSWHMACHRNNQTMLSWPMWMDRGRPDLNTTYPVWLYGVEVDLLTGLSTQRTFTISQLETHKEARTRYTSSFETGLFVLETAKSHAHQYTPMLLARHGRTGEEGQVFRKIFVRVRYGKSSRHNNLLRQHFKSSVLLLGLDL